MVRLQPFIGTILLLLGWLCCACPAPAQIRPLTPKGSTRAVVVGISEYQDKTIGDLKYAHRDAEAFAGYLQSESGGSLDERNFRLLTNENATLGQISAALEWLQEASQPGDRAIIYFSGHGDAVRGGSREGYMLCHDAVVYRYNVSGGLSLNWLQNVITTLSIEKNTEVLFFADACRSGGIEDRMGVRAFGQDMARQYGNEIKLLSCQPQELSHEGEQWGGGRGVFSYYLIEGLMGFADEDGDEVITLMELELYVKRKVALDMRPVHQIPISRGEQTRQVAIVNSLHFAALKQQKSRTLPAFKPAASRANVFGHSLHNTDSTAMQYYHAFMQAIARKDFLAPEEDCAEKWFALLMDNPAISPLHSELRRTYAAALQDDAQVVLNKYLMMDAAELAKIGHQALDHYKNFPNYLTRAAEIIGPKDPRFKNITSRSHLFKGITDYLRLGSVKTPEYLNPIINNWQISLSLEAHNPAASFFLMDIYARKFAEFDSAAHYFINTIKLDGFWPLPYANWGYYLAFKFKKYDLAESVLHDGLQLDSSNTYILNALGTTLFYQKKTNEAISIITKSLCIDSTDYLAWANLGALYQSIGDMPNAIHSLQRSLEINPDQFQGHNMIGLLYYYLKDFPKAEHHFLIAHRKEPKDIPLLGRICLLYLDAGNYTGLEATCTLIENIDATNHRHWYYRACLYAELGEQQMAMKTLEKALLAYPDLAKAIRCNELSTLVDTNDDFRNLISKHQPTTSKQP